MSIALQAKVDALEKRMTELERRLPPVDMTTTEVCEALDANRKTLKLPEKRKSA